MSDQAFQNFIEACKSGYVKPSKKQILQIGSVANDSQLSELSKMGYVPTVQSFINDCKSGKIPTEDDFFEYVNYANEDEIKRLFDIYFSIFTSSSYITNDTLYKISHMIYLTDGNYN